MGVYFRRVQIFLPGGFFSRAGGGDIPKIKPKLGVQNDKNQGKKTINAPVVATKKSHWAKKFAFGRNDTPRAPVNQNQQKLDYVRFFQVNLKFPLTTSDTLSSVLTNLVPFSPISHEY